MSKIIGIDLGTTKSVVAVIEGGAPFVITNSEGGRTTPTIVCFTKDGNRLVGQAAKRLTLTNPENTVYSVQRFMGRRFEALGSEASQIPYGITRAPNGSIRIFAHDRVYSPAEVSAMILEKLKQASEAYLGQNVTKAVIAVPAHFNNPQRQAITAAARIAGLDVLRFVDSSTAAALAYGFQKKANEIAAVLDWGGGAFSISIVEIDESGVEVKSVSGDAILGGDDIDRRLIRWLIDEFERIQNIDLSNDKTAFQRLREAAEQAKIELSYTMETEINLPFITSDAAGPKHMVLSLARVKFESLIDDILERVLEHCRKALKDATVGVGGIDRVLMVGGSTRIPKIQEMVKALFGKAPHSGMNSDEAVAIGAAVTAGVLSGEVKDVLLLDVFPFSLGIETLGGVFTKLIERNTTIPTRKSERFSTTTDNQPYAELHALEGEHPMARDNRTIGQLLLTEIPTAPRGVPQIEVTLDIDANRIVTLSAKDLVTGREQLVTLPSDISIEEDRIKNRTAWLAEIPLESEIEGSDVEP